MPGRRSASAEDSKRSCQPELLDSLAPDHPDAIHSRRDLRIVNRFMRNLTWFERTLSGLVRPDDISSADTILSSSIAEARVEFINKGTLTDAEKAGWFSRLYDLLRPF